ncbi:hypothetical protein K0M31_016619 [Melipona bicolor]|uniref:Uncharacterized protein n=1 Tax=Melipona bicolor TaxID=60889 RepID=A0AA40KES0_9HYME|nr:hypothetical protein K0M31_016619 [Melipona bicolor]
MNISRSRNSTRNLFHVQPKSMVFVIKVAGNQHTENELLDRKETPGHAVSLHKRSNIEEPPCNSRYKNVDRIERGQLVFIPSRIRVGGWSEWGRGLPLFISPPSSPFPSLSLYPHHDGISRAFWPTWYEVGKVRIQSSSEFLIVGPRDSCRLIASCFLSMESSCHRLSRLRTHASRLRSTTHARYREEKRNRHSGRPIPREISPESSPSRFWTTDSFSRLEGKSME